VIKLWNRLPKRLWSLHPWLYSKPNWTRSWSACSSCLCSGQTRWPPEVPSNLNYSAIL